MKIRRYLGFDCNSWDGFNNGRYVDGDTFDVADYAAAEKACIEVLEEYLGRRLGEYDYEDVSHGDGPCIQVITLYTDDEGNEITADQWSDLNEEKECGGYLYIYVSAEKE